MADSVVCRDKRGRFSKTLQETSEPAVAENIEIDHNYGVGHLCIAGATGCAVCCPGIDKLLGSTKINTSTSWHSGRRLVEWGTLLDHLKFCSRCYNGPLILSHETIKGEMKCGLGGYLYIQCTSCQELNRVPYGSTHKENPSSKGMPSFCVNTKLGAGKKQFSMPFSIYLLLIIICILSFIPIHHLTLYMYCTTCIGIWYVHPDYILAVGWYVLVFSTLSSFLYSY